MLFKKVTVLGTLTIVLLQDLYFGRVYGSIGDCFTASNATLFATSAEYADAYNELFDSGPLYQNFIECQDNFVNASIAYSETCELDRELDSMFNKFVVACQGAGGFLYVEDSSFECTKTGSTISVIEKNLPFCILQDVTSCTGIQDSNPGMSPVVYEAYTERGYYCQAELLDYHSYGPNEEITTDPPATSGFDKCVTDSNATLFSRSSQFADAYYNNNAIDLEWGNFIQCQQFVLQSSTVSDHTCYYDFKVDDDFDPLMKECKNAGGVMYVVDSGFECTEAGVSIIKVNKRNSPYCILPEMTSCQGIQDFRLILDPEAYADFTEKGYDCQVKLIDFYQLEEPAPEDGEHEDDNDPTDQTLEKTTDEVDACIIASNATLLSKRPQYADAYSEINESDEEWDDWIQCQTDFLEASIAYDETCDYDYAIDYIFETYVKECEEADGVIYLFDYLIECSNTDSRIIIVQKNNPKCVVPEEALCQTVLGGTDKPVVRGPLDVKFTDGGYSCTTLSSTFYPLEESNDHSDEASKQIEEKSTDELEAGDDDADDGKMPLVIGIISVVAVAIIGTSGYVFYRRFERNRSQMDPTARNNSDEDVQKKRMEAMTQAIHIAATQNAVFQATTPSPTFAPTVPPYAPTQPTNDVGVLQSVPIAQPFYYYGKEDG